MRKTTVFIAALLFIHSSSFSQTVLEGDLLLELVGKPVSDPVFQQLKKQETFYTDAWDSKFTIYINRSGDLIKEIEFQNGKLKYSSTERFGYYSRKLPMQLNWNMIAPDFEVRFGKPVYVNSQMGLADYAAGAWKLRVSFEKDKVVAICFKKDESVTNVSKPPANNVLTPQVKPVQSAISNNIKWPVRLDTVNEKAEVNWPALKELIISNGNFMQFAGSDSVDYIGQVYYSTPNRVEGFNRTVIMRRKKNNESHYEAFYKIRGADTNKVKNIFFALYEELKKVIKDSSGQDFILGSVAKKSLSETPVNWLAQWTIYTNYSTLPAGLKKIRIALMLSGFTDMLNKDKRDYTFKIYVIANNEPYDFYTWDKPL